MAPARRAPGSAEQRRRSRCRMRFGRRKKRKGQVAETGKWSSRPRKGWRETLIPSKVGEVADRQLSKAGCRHCPELKLGRGCSWPESDSFRREQHANRSEERRVGKECRSR